MIIVTPTKNDKVSTPRLMTSQGHSQNELSTYETIYIEREKESERGKQIMHGFIP